MNIFIVMLISLENDPLQTFLLYTSLSRPIYLYIIQILCEFSLKYLTNSNITKRYIDLACVVLIQGQADTKNMQNVSAL